MIALAASSSSPVVTFIGLLGMSIWIGGFITVVLVTRVARKHLHPASQVTFFRALGRDFGIVSTVALALALVAGAILLAGREIDGTVTAAIVLAALVIASTAAGVVQARGMSRLRSRVLRQPDDGEVLDRQVRAARRATILRGIIGVLSLGLLAVTATLI